MSDGFSDRWRVEWLDRTSDEREVEITFASPDGDEFALSLSEEEARLLASSLSPLEALETLVASCELAYAGPTMDEFSDDEDISWPPSGITFGMIRSARAALASATADFGGAQHPSAAVPDTQKGEK